MESTCAQTFTTVEQTWNLGPENCVARNAHTPEKSNTTYNIEAVSTRSNLETYGWSSAKYAALAVNIIVFCMNYLF